MFDSLSPRTTWSSLRPPVFWLHDVGDRFEPVSEAETAAATGASESGLGFWATDLSGLLLFAAGVLGAGE